MNTLTQRNLIYIALLILLGILTLASCAPAATMIAEPTEDTSHIMEVTVEPITELRVVEFEYPVSLKLGDSDVIRLSLIPSEDGYTAKAEYEEHTVTSEEVPIKYLEGYTLKAVARVDGTGFDISPNGDQSYILQPNTAITWRWSLSPRSPGKQRVSILLLLRWEPDEEGQGQVKESHILDRSIEIQVISFLGMRKPEVLAFGFSGLALSGILGIWAWAGGRSLSGKRLRVINPDRQLSIETAPNITLNHEETSLMQALFNKYQRLILQREFLSGYSGARTFLARPVKSNGQSDAETIIKIGPRADIDTECEHFETYVKDRLPPITARIQNQPVTIKGGAKAALQYTCISEPGKSPISLRQALLAKPDPAYIQHLFDTFGTYWWMQRQPYTFRYGQEYDRLLPPHLVLEPIPGTARRVIHPYDDPAGLRFVPGDVVTAQPFERYEVRADGKSLTLFGAPLPGKPVLRIRWQHLRPPSGTTARVLALRENLLEQSVVGFDLLGLPDPLRKLDGWLQEVVQGTRSVIHGDLNLENILVGPGNLLWLIDFAQTREGHPLYDFSHLAAEVIGQIIVEQCQTPQGYLNLLRDGRDSLLNKIEEIATMCQFDPNTPTEYRQALTLACLGALKYRNLTQRAKHYLYITAAFYGSTL